MAAVGSNSSVPCHVPSHPFFPISTTSIAVGAAKEKCVWKGWFSTTPTFVDAIVWVS